MPLRHWSHTDPVSVRGPQARHRKVSRSRICALRAGSVPSGCAIARRLPTESPARTQPTATETDPMTEGTADRHQHTPAPGRTRRVVDTHAHWDPTDWLKPFERDGPAEAPKLERTASGYTIPTDR